jgi:hypothetical protein
MGWPNVTLAPFDNWPTGKFDKRKMYMIYLLQLLFLLLQNGVNITFLGCYKE